MSSKGVERRSYVIDASVVSRWYLANPPFVAQAILVRSDFQDGRIALFTPSNCRYEVVGAIHRAVVARHLRSSDGETLVQHFLDSSLTWIASDPLVLPAFRLSIRYGCSFYDSVYLALAETTRHPFLHADASLHRVLNSRFPLELWVEDYERQSA